MEPLALLVPRRTMASEGAAPEVCAGVTTAGTGSQIFSVFRFGLGRGSLCEHWSSQDKKHGGFEQGVEATVDHAMKIHPSGRGWREKTKGPFRGGGMAFV